MSTYDERLAAFQRFDAKNPHVYRMFERFAFEAYRAGCTRLSTRLIIERMRWETKMKTTGDKYKLDNSHARFMRERLVRENPEFAGFFETRQSADWPDYDFKETLF